MHCDQAMHNYKHIFLHPEEFAEGEEGVCPALHSPDCHVRRSYPLPFRLLLASLQLLSPVGSHGKLLQRVQSSFGRVLLFSSFRFRIVLSPLRGMNERASSLCVAAPNVLGLVWVRGGWAHSSPVIHTAGCVRAAPAFTEQGEDITKTDVMLGNAWQSSSRDAAARLCDKCCNTHVRWWLGLL